MRRRRRKINKTYSLSYLLSRQPKTLRKHADYPAMLSYLQASSRLQKLRISRRCYRLLDKAVIRPEHLHNFYRTYRLPEDPFFPYFFRIKRDYLEYRQRLKRERMDYIAAKMRSLPPGELDFIKFLARYEERLNRRGNFPVWTLYLFPTSKKRVNEMHGYNGMEWIGFFREYLKRLERRYPEATERSRDILLASYILNLLPEDGELKAPSEVQVKSGYRRLSKIHHPDSGGDAAFFVELKWARDVLIS